MFLWPSYTVWLEKAAKTRHEICIKERPKFSTLSYFILPYPDFGNGRHFCKEKARTQWRSSRQCALSRMDRLCAKDGATSDAESFAVTGTVSHIRQMPRIKRPGWRSAFFLFPTRLSFDIYGACSTLGNTKIQGTEFMIQRNQKS